VTPMRVAVVGAVPPAGVAPLVGVAAARVDDEAAVAVVPPPVAGATDGALDAPAAAFVAVGATVGTAVAAGVPQAVRKPPAAEAEQPSASARCMNSRRDSRPRRTACIMTWISCCAVIRLVLPIPTPSPTGLDTR